METTTDLTHKPGTLKRSMKMLGTLLITLSAVTPASSVFIIIPGIISTAGTGAFLSMVIAAFVGVCMALVYAELSSAYPLTGGEYAIVGRVVGPITGFVVMGVNLVTTVLILAVIALGMSTYLGVLFPALPMVPTAIATVALTTFIGILNIRSNAILTGIFLITEINSGAIAVISENGDGGGHTNGCEGRMDEMTIAENDRVGDKISDRPGGMKEPQPGQR